VYTGLVQASLLCVASFRWVRPTVIGFIFSGGLLVAWCEEPGGFEAFSVRRWPSIFLQYFDAVGWVFSPVKLSPG